MSISKNNIALQPLMNRGMAECTISAVSKGNMGQGVNECPELWDRKSQEFAEDVLTEDVLT